MAESAVDINHGWLKWKELFLSSVCGTHVHVQQTGHAISWENMRPVMKENRWCQRRWIEACMTFKTKNVIVNRDYGKVLPDVYKSLIDQL